MTREELEKLLAAATPGPWEVSERAKDWRPQVVSTEHGPICTMHIPEVGDADSNAALICAAVNALPELLARVKRLERALAIYDRCADNCINHAMFSDKQTVVDDIAQAVRNARAALKETGQ